MGSLQHSNLLLFTQPDVLSPFACTHAAFNPNRLPIDLCQRSCIIQSCEGVFSKSDLGTVCCMQGLRSKAHSAGNTNMAAHRTSPQHMHSQIPFTFDRDHAAFSLAGGCCPMPDLGTVGACTEALRSKWSAGNSTM